MVGTTPLSSQLSEDIHQSVRIPNLKGEEHPTLEQLQRRLSLSLRNEHEIDAFVSELEQQLKDEDEDTDSNSDNDEVRLLKEGIARLKQARLGMQEPAEPENHKRKTPDLQKTQHQAERDLLQQALAAMEHKAAAFEAQLRQAQTVLSSQEKTIHSQLQDVEASRAKIDSLSLISAQQEALVERLETKLADTNTLVRVLQEQVGARDRRIAELEEQHAQQIVHVQTELDRVLRHAAEAAQEKKQMERVIEFMERSLARQDRKMDHNTEALRDLERLSMIQEKDLDEKRESIQSLHLQLKERESASLDLQEQLTKLRSLLHDRTDTDIDQQRATALESRVAELDEALANLEAEKKSQLAKIEELEGTLAELERDRAILREKDISGLVTELETRVRSLQQARRQDQEEFAEQLEHAQAEATKVQRDQKRVIDALTSSLQTTQGKLDAALEKRDVRVRNSCDKSTKELRAQYRDMLCGSQGPEAVIERLVQALEDNAQLASHVTDLEGQLVTQRNQLSSETKELEQEVLRLTSSNSRLEKEVEQRRLSKRDSALYMQQQQTPSTPPRAMSPHQYHLNKLQRDSSTSSTGRMPKSSSYRMMVLDEDDNKRASTGSVQTPPRRRRTSSSASNIPPPSAPPSNPLPPVPTALPPVPSSPTSPSSKSRAQSPPPSVQSPPSRSISTPMLQRQNSNTTATASESEPNGLTSDRYDRIIRSMQRKLAVAEGDVRAHQDVIGKLEAQLTRSETSTRDVKKQMDALSREKQATLSEIQHLRSQLSQYQSASDRSLEDQKQLQEELDKERRLKEKAEKARHILEARMEELMSKKNKFVCF